MKNIKEGDLIEQERERRLSNLRGWRRIEMKHRRTGRTTDMLNRAADLARKGHYVFVVVEAAMLDATANEFCRQHNGKRAGKNKVYLDGGGELSFESGCSTQMDWQGMRMRGAHPSCKLLVDPYCIERRFDRMLDELFRYGEHGDVGGK